MIGTALYGFVFYQAKLYAEVGLQGFYFITSLQAIYIWLRGGQNHTEKPVGRISRKGLISILYAVFGLMAWSGLKNLQRIDREQQLKAIEK